MVINFKKKETKLLEELDTGEVFKYENSVYIKTNDDWDGYSFVVVNLATGQAEDMSDDTEVEPVNAVLEIE
jgi:hypothetical protein